jgi:hypothetical protein
MNDPDSYGLYCAMLLQGYQQHGTALNNIDPSIVDACQDYLNPHNDSYHETNKEASL